jgi:hypothetical protein
MARARKRVPIRNLTGWTHVKPEKHRHGRLLVRRGEALVLEMLQVHAPLVPHAGRGGVRQVCPAAGRRGEKTQVDSRTKSNEATEI